MFVLAGIALLRANSPVLGIFVSGEYNTASAEEINEESWPLKGSGVVSWRKRMMAAMALSNHFFPCSADVDKFKIFHPDVNSYITKNPSEELGDIKKKTSK